MRDEIGSAWPDFVGTRSRCRAPFPSHLRGPPPIYLHEADARGGALDVDEHRPRERDLVLILAALFPGHFHRTRLAHDRTINSGCIYMYGSPFG